MRTEGSITHLEQEPAGMAEAPIPPRRKREVPFADPAESAESADGRDGQPIGFDIGTSRIVVARNNGGRPSYEAQLNAFITLPYSDLTEGLLVRENVFYEVVGAEFVVAGDDAHRFAEIFHVETRRPLVSGTLNREEPHSLNVIRRIIGKLLGKAARPGQRVRFSVPTPSVGADSGAVYHQELLFREILGALGYDAAPIDEGLAVVFGELGASNYTGIAISFGSGLSSVCLSVLSMPVISFSVPKGGDYIDRQASIATGESATRLRVHKEQSFKLNGFGGDRTDNVLTVYHDDVIASVVDCLRTNLSSPAKPRIDQRIPLVICGGTSMPKGFLEHFEKALQSCEFPLPLSEVRLSSDPLNSTARGALVAAMSEGVAMAAVAG
jgi:hypothetical protein